MEERTPSAHGHILCPEFTSRVRYQYATQRLAQTSAPLTTRPWLYNSSLLLKAWRENWRPARFARPAMRFPDAGGAEAPAASVSRSQIAPPFPLAHARSVAVWPLLLRTLMFAPQ